MPQGPLGRTNRSFPVIWLSLSDPHGEEPERQVDELVESSLASNSPLDVTSNPVLWGSRMRGADATITFIGGAEALRAPDAEIAGNLVEADLVSTLSAMGRETIDVYFLKVAAGARLDALDGVLAALEDARSEGMIRHLGGFLTDADALQLYRQRDAFEVVLLPRNHLNDSVYRQAIGTTVERRAGVVTCRPFNWGFGMPFFALPDVWRLRNLTQSFYGLTIPQTVLSDLTREHPVLVGVRSAAEAQAALDSASVELPEGLPSMLEPFKEAFQEGPGWMELLESPDPVHRSAARRRLDAQRV